MQDAIILHRAARAATGMILMGWLRDYMTTAQPPIPSFGQLAQACLDHSQWPGHLALKYRSLSTLFSKLDRGKDLDWLRDRLEVQQVLAQLLGRPIADLRTAVGEAPALDQSRFVRLIDVRFARELDLVKEDLPPGIPRVLGDPPAWEPTWWVAPPGSGRSLTAAWLRARGLAHTRLVRSRADLQDLPVRGPLFLDVASDTSADDLALTLADFETLRAFSRPVCLAAPFEPPSFSVEGKQLARLVSPAPEEYIPELVDWVAARLDESGEFRADRSERWLLDVALPAGAIRTWGDALGLLGMTDEVALRSLRAKSLDEIGAHFVERRLRAASETLTLSPAHVSGAFDLLKECAARVLVTGKNALDAPHPIDEWTALLSTPGSEDAPDPEWFSAALRGALGAQVSRRDLRRAAKKLAPSAFQLTRGLEAAGLLVRDPVALSRDESGADRTLHPRWLVSLLSARASREVLRLSPAEWGRVLLMGRDGDLIIASLLDEARRDHFEACHLLVEEYEEGSAAHSAALEGAVVAMGLAVLEGLEVPEALVEGLFEALGDELLLLDKIPEPRLTCEEQKAQLFTRTTFLVALLALCQVAPFPLEHLDPLRSKNVELRRAFLAVCLEWTARPWLSIPTRTGLLAALEALCTTETEQLPRPAALRLFDSWEDAPPQLVQEAVASFPAEVLLRRALERGLSETSVYRYLWNYARGLRAPGALFAEEQGERDFWRHISTEDLSYRVTNALPIFWEALLPHQFASWLSLDEAPPLPSGAARTIPLDATMAAIERRGLSVFSEEALEPFLARAKAKVALVLERAITSGDSATVEHILLRTSPAATATVSAALPRAPVLLQTKPPILRAVRTYLLRAVRERHTGFEACFDLLAEVERGVGPLRQLP